MLERGIVLVWEWQDEDDLWKPYSPQVAHYIEQVLQETPKANSVSLGEADSNLTPYILDLISMNQFRLDTGTLHPVRRVRFPLNSAPGQGITWDFEAHPGQWIPFETRLSVLIQGALERQQPGVRLGEPCSGSNICFQSMTKLEFPSQRRTRVRARGHYPYPTSSNKHVPADLQSGLPLHLNGIMKSKTGTTIPKPGQMSNISEPLNSNCGPVNFNSGLINYNIGPVHSNSEFANPHHRLLNYNHSNENSTNILLNSNAGLITSNDVFSYCEPIQQNSVFDLGCSSTISGNSKQGVQHSGWGHSKPVLMRSDSRPSNQREWIVRSDSRPGDARTGLSRSNSRHNDARPSLSRSNSRPADFKPGFSECYSRPTEPRAELVNIHTEVPSYRPGTIGRDLSRSVSLGISRSPPPCACPQCLLVQSVKSASWPGWQPVKKPSGGQRHLSQERTDKGNTRVPLVPLSNIEGSGMIAPALAGISGLLISAVGLPICLSVPRKPVLYPPPIKKRDLRPVPGIVGTSRKISNKKSKKPEEIIKKFLQKVKIPSVEDCAMCLRPLAEREVGRLYRCSHTHHVRCLASLYKDGTLRCPTCRTLYGRKLGSQPPGKMSYHLIPYSLPGHDDCQTIRIMYDIAPGIQGSGQPNPGMKFSTPDFPLCCYLPNTEKGREVLRHLIEAWDHRILFPIQPSRVPGVPDSVSTSRIPLKTEFGSNLTGKGFPDPQYLDSVLRQLRDWGMTGR
ncbi:E3 ubiquitin- ligase DTX4-like [Pelobates cultripes]|uniref:E3 ubiquitin-protein ligase n=1 Tax=Pelobates cultripes TaxID=61616 RepID=A0AAD1TDX7_PELCU|nr:E3 ubiquitin- ligase DTX4-like [Pelobates cultripes]CAH2321527.1 E3 ubiquitin- ligase DTX4-like [Pelobates cultripes]